MNENQDKQENLLDTTDCLEAVGVFRGWKNGLFVITVLCLVLLQVAFWAVNLELIRIEGVKPAPAAAVGASETTEPNAAIPKAAAVEPDEITQAAREVTNEVNQPRGDTPLGRAAEYMKMEGEPACRTKFGYGAKSGYLARPLIRFFDFVLILAAILYCLAMLFCLKISLLGRLGGINHISRAFFLSLLFVVLLLPWQKFFGSAVKGVIYTPDELVRWLNWYRDPASGVLGMVLYYLRFTGYWLVVMLIGILSQIRSGRWAKATLRRLEII
ncbi:MAG: hypothetical protein ACYSUP_08720 [Planctomycetota bacterium]|jgi:hypothetical protein